MTDTRLQMLPICSDTTTTGPAHSARNPPPPVLQIEPDGSVVAKSSQPLTGVTEKMWNIGQTLRVSMTGGTPIIHSKVRQYAEQWTQYANINFAFVDPSESADIRVAFQPGKGSWSGIGRDAGWRLLNDVTMNFGWFTDDTPDVEFSRTVLHEFGHALGLVHEHQSPTSGIAWDREKAYAYFHDTQGWDRPTVDAQVFEKYSVTQTNYSVFDPQSIMEYQIPPEITLDGRGITGGTSLSPTDIRYISMWYPHPPSPQNAAGLIRTGDDCDEIDFTAEYNVVGGNNVEFRLSPASGITWWKAIDVPIGASGYHRLEMQDGHSANAVLPRDQIDNARPIRFAKAKFLGRHTGLSFTWDVLAALPAGSRLSLFWKRDRC